MKPRVLRPLALALAAALMPACGTHGPGSPAPVPVYGTDFTYSPVPVANINYIEPLGHLNPVGHVLPTDHVYFYFTGSALPVSAPGPGRVLYMMQPVGTDWKIWVQMNPDITWIVDHVLPDPTLKAGDVVAAGQVIGTTPPGMVAMDLGVSDGTVTLPFVNSSRYSGETLHTVSPFPLYVDPLKSQLYALVQRVGTDKDSGICFDQAGTLAGNWFEQSVPDDSSADGPAGWPNSISFAPDNFDPTVPCVSIGGPVALMGKWKAAPATPAYSAITPASGAVGIQLLYYGGGTVAGLMMVQMLDASTAKIEVFAGSSATSAPFTGAAYIYKR